MFLIIHKRRWVFKRIAFVYFLVMNSFNVVAIPSAGCQCEPNVMLSAPRDSHHFDKGRLRRSTSTDVIDQRCPIGPVCYARIHQVGQI